MAIAIYLEYKSNVALYRRLSDALRKAIMEGRLKLGEPMPSIRELSETLKLSRSTILKAYEDLKTQGLVVANSGSGTFVASTLPGDLGELAPAFLSAANRPVSFKPLPLSDRGRTIFAVGKRQANEHVHVPALEYGGTPIELSPMRDWKTLMIKHCDVSHEEHVAEMIDPLGHVMSMPRRHELLEYAAATGAFIVEDDFDNEFRYGRPILPSIKALDQYDCVIYMASFWKVLYQSLRLSFVVFPDCLVNIGALGKSYLERHLPLLEQLALIDFINDGYLEKHLKQTQRVLAFRRQSLILAITRYLKDMVDPLTDGGGTHLILNFQANFFRQRHRTSSPAKRLQSNEHQTILCQHNKEWPVHSALRLSRPKQYRQRRQVFCLSSPETIRS